MRCGWAVTVRMKITFFKRHTLPLPHRVHLWRSARLGRGHGVAHLWVARPGSASQKEHPHKSWTCRGPIVLRQHVNVPVKRHRDGVAKRSAVAVCFRRCCEKCWTKLRGGWLPAYPPGNVFVVALAQNDVAVHTNIVCALHKLRGRGGFALECAHGVVSSSRGRRRGCKVGSNLTAEWEELRLHITAASTR